MNLNIKTFIQNKILLHFRDYCFLCIRSLVPLITLAVLIVMPLCASAGGGPETTLLVVNGDSPLSLYIANEYVKMREIPRSHVVWLHNIPFLRGIDIATFRNKVWEPIQAHIMLNNLEEEIDTIVYSADFPYSVDITADIKKQKGSVKRMLGYQASLTGLTYFARRVAAGDTGYLGINRYFRGDLSTKVSPPRNPTESEIVQFNDAKGAMKKKDYESAVEILRSLVGSYPWSNQVWYELARGLAALKRDDDALRALTEAVDKGWTNSAYLQKDRHFKGLRRQAVFKSLIKRINTMKLRFQPAVGFRSNYIWTGGNTPMVNEEVESLDRYYLSTLLTYTGRQGNSVNEVLSYLSASVSSDGSFPDGTVYLMENRDIRSLTRERYFHTTVEALAERGRHAKILAKGQRGQDGVLPQNKDDVIGAVIGARKFDWGNSRSRLLPGAIAESLTSYGGHFNKYKQTKLTEFLRHGAAGSSGAVTEPLAIQAKFPVSYLHVHYADGSSLAEAFYQSVEAPYQLIIVGEPLARPFAHFASVRLLKPDPGQKWSGTVSLQPYVKAAQGHAIDRVELWVDGQYVDSKPPGEVILWDTGAVEDGSHDLRLVAVDASPIETRSYVRAPVTVANTKHRIDVDNVKNPVILGDEMLFSGSAPGARHVQLFQGVRLLGTADAEKGRWMIRIPSDSIGPGDVLLFLKCQFQDDTILHSKPISINIEKPLLLAAVKSEKRNYAPGLRAVIRDREGHDKELLIKEVFGLLTKSVKNSNGVSFIHLEGEFRVEKTGFYQLIVNMRGGMYIEVDDSVHLDTVQGSSYGELFLPLHLERGWHSLKMDLTPEGPPRIIAVLNGEQVATVLAGDRLRH
jgi:hypothetical protein